MPLKTYQSMSGFAVVTITVEAESLEQAESKVKDKLGQLNQILANLPDGVSVEVESDDMENVEVVTE